MKAERTAYVDGVFAAAAGKAVDFPQSEYETWRTDYDRIAASNGYRLAGIRLQRAVFTSKPADEKQAEREEETRSAMALAQAQSAPDAALP